MIRERLGRAQAAQRRAGRRTSVSPMTPRHCTGAIHARQTAGTAGVLTAGETVEAAAERWRGFMRQDRRDLESGDFRNHTAPTSGFLTLPRDLVIALRYHACLVWGAVDLGPDPRGRLLGSWDVMHFDARIAGVGAVLAEGVQPVPKTGHPCVSATASSTSKDEEEQEEEEVLRDSDTIDLSQHIRSPMGEDPHGRALARVAQLSTRLPRIPLWALGRTRERNPG